MTARDEKSRGVGASGSAATVAEITAKTEACNLQSPDKSPQPIVLSPAGTLFSPAESLAWVLGLLAVGACIAPWLARGWLWLELIAAAMGLLACYDALALWRSRGEFAPVLLPAEKGLGGREGQTIQVPLALTGSGRRGPHSEVRAAIMPATEESETAMRVRGGPQRLKLELPSLDGGSVPVNRAPILLWSWTPEIALLRRGLWPGPRVGIERRSRFGIWRLRQWFDSPKPLRIEADLRSGRREVLHSPVYRACGLAADAVDRARARFRTPARISTWRYLLGDRVEIHGAAERSGYSAFPMGAEAGGVFRRGSIAGVRACARFGRCPPERYPTSTRAAAVAGSRCGNGAGGRDRRAGTG